MDKVIRMRDNAELISINQFDSVWRGAKCKSCGRKKFCGDPIMK